MMKFYTIFFSIFSIQFAQAKLLDKVTAVVDDKIITQSQIKRVKQTLSARRDISPQIYGKESLSSKDVVQIFVRRNFIKKKLAEIGYVIGDDKVESQIKSTEKRLNLNRKALLKFLGSRKITFDEYFEIIRETIEHNYFFSVVIKPLISITEQEIKNEYYRQNINNKTLSFNYKLVDFSLHKKHFKGNMLKEYKDVLVKFQKSGVLPQAFSKVDTNVIENISEDGLTQTLKNTLKRTNEGSFSDVITLNGQYHVFFVKGKSLVDSESYLQEKNNIYAKLMKKAIADISGSWFQNEEKRHYVRYFF